MSAPYRGSARAPVAEPTHVESGDRPLHWLWLLIGLLPCVIALLAGSNWGVQPTLGLLMAGAGLWLLVRDRRGHVDGRRLALDAGPIMRTDARVVNSSHTRATSAVARYLGATALVGTATTVGKLGAGHLASPDVVMLYLVAIMAAAVRLGRGPSLLASALSVAAYDFFFVPPYYTFAVTHERHLLTFAVMFATGLFISSLTLRLRRQEHAAILREERTAALYALARDLGAATDEAAVLDVTSQHVRRTFDSAAETSTREGRVVVTRAPDAPALVHDQSLLLDAFMNQATLALERARLADAARSAALRASTEEMRGTLLSAVSHDLRTPLAAITGAATALRDQSAALDAGQRIELLATVCDEAVRMERLVSNLLDMTRLESGLQVKREWVPLEELVGSALTRLEGQLTGRPISTRVPEDLPLLSADPVLLEQVFVNLLENAARYTPPQSPIEIAARTHNDAIEVEVADRGPGLGDQETQVFERFFHGSHAGSSGVGLGLPICRGIVIAHGGDITASNRPDGGAIFRITLPMLGVPPSVPSDAEVRSEGSP